MDSNKFDIGKMIVADIEYKYYLLLIQNNRYYRIIIYKVPKLTWR